jgi:hypothetical protein
LSKEVFPAQKRFEKREKKEEQTTFQLEHPCFLEHGNRKYFYFFFFFKFFLTRKKAIDREKK